MKTLSFFFFHLFRDPIYLLDYIFRRLQSGFKVNVKFYSLEELFTEVSNGKSLIRMGDGEAYLMHHGDMGYEPYSPELRLDLMKIAKNYTIESPYILSLPEMDINKSNQELREINRLELWLPLKILYTRIFPKNIKYGDTVTFYRTSFKPFFFNLIEGKDLIIVSRAENINSLNRDYLSKCTSCETIVTPDIGSYSHKDDISTQITSALSRKKNPLLIVSCGPLSKVLAYEFSEKGVQSIDMGRGIELISFRSDGDLEFQI